MLNLLKERFENFISRVYGDLAARRELEERLKEACFNGIVDGLCLVDVDDDETFLPDEINELIDHANIVAMPVKDRRNERFKVVEIGAGQVVFLKFPFPKLETILPDFSGEQNWISSVPGVGIYAAKRNMRFVIENFSDLEGGNTNQSTNQLKKGAVMNENTAQEHKELVGGSLDNLSGVHLDNLETDYPGRTEAEYRKIAFLLGAKSVGGYMGMASTNIAAVVDEDIADIVAP